MCSGYCKWIFSGITALPAPGTTILPNLSREEDEFILKIPLAPVRAFFAILQHTEQAELMIGPGPNGCAGEPAPDQRHAQGNRFKSA